MHVNEILGQQFGRFASRVIAGRMTLKERGFALGTGTLLAKPDGKALLIEALERIWTLLAVAYGEKILRRWDRFAAWQNTGKAAAKVLPRYPAPR